VLIPRPETELLVERAIGWLQSHPHKRKVLDIGTGSGCIGITVASHISNVDILMTDISEEALGVARRNAEKYGLQNRLEFRRSDLLKQVPEHFDMICANLPYIPTQILNTLPVADKEPRLALDGGQTGLRQLKQLLVQAAQKLDAGGLMLLEIDPTEREPILQMGLERFPGDKVRFLQDLAGKDRCVEIERRYHILHLCQRKELFEYQELGEYRADSLASEGFIHCSLPEQINEVANRYFKGMPDMVMLMLDPDKLTSEIRWEESEGSYYPHVYGAINREAVYTVNDIHPDNDGVYRIIFSQIK